jgi:endonuclease/exonuclease/phosphatase family metal-dependent hydrolase
MKYNKFTIAVFMLMLMSFDGMEAQEISPAENNSLRIMSYNVRNCRGMDDVTDFDRVAAVINRVDADVIALQELDSMTARQGVYVLSELAGRTLKHYT